MVNTRNNKEKQQQKDATEEKLEKRSNAPVGKIDLETPQQIIDDVGKKRRKQHKCQISMSRKQRQSSSR